MKEKKPTAFDVMGAFNDFYSSPEVPESMSIAVDFGRSIPAKAHRTALESIADPKSPLNLLPPSKLATPTAVAAAPVAGGGLPSNIAPVTPEAPIQNSFFNKVLVNMEKAYNLSAQAVSFGLLLKDKNNPLYADTNGGLGKSWEAARQISPGRSYVKTAVGKPIDALASLINTASVGKDDTADEFVKKHLLFASNDFNIYDPEQAERAFREQNVGRFTSWGSDVVARFTIDPTIVAGKAVKAYKTAGIAVKNVDELKSIISGETKGLKAKRVKGNLDKFIKDTDGMTEADLFRIRAIRESSNPGSLAEVIADANKIEDQALRHKAKENIVLWSMGDVQGASELMKNNKILAAKIANLQDEISDAKYLGASRDKTTNALTMDILNSGENLQKNVDLAAQYEKELADNFKKLSVEGALDPTKVPSIDALSGLRQSAFNSQALIDIRGKGGAGAAYAAYPVRLMTGFAYKRPKGWIDFADNQSVQTIDNMLSRVRGITDERVAAYEAKIAGLDKQIELAGKDIDKDVLKSLNAEKEAVMKDLELSKFTVDDKNRLFSQYVSAVDPVERAAAYMRIEEELFNTVAKQFGFDKDEVRKAWATFATGRAKAHNLIRERAYTGAIDPVTGAPVGSKVTPIMGIDGAANIVPLPLNETQLAKQLPTLDIDSMYRVLNKYARSQRFEKGGKLWGNLRKGSTAVGRVGDELTENLDSLLKFEVLARVGYPIRNVAEGTMRIMQVAGPMAAMARAGTASKNLLFSRFKGSKLEDFFDFSNRFKLETYKTELEATLSVADDPDAIVRQIAEIDAMLAGKKKMVDKFGVGLNQITIDGKTITYQDAKGVTKEQAKFIEDRFINNAAQIVDNHFNESSKRLRSIFETNGDFVIVKGTDATWEDAYLRVVNRQVRNSKLTSILLQNKPREVLVKEASTFLERTPEGRQILRNLALGRDVESIVEANMQNIESLFPKSINPALKAIAEKRNITSEDIKKYFGTSGLNRPDVNGAQVSIANGTSAVSRGIKTFLDHFYNVMGEIPERELVRNPLFVDLYRKRMASVVDNAVATYPGDTIPAEYLRKAEAQARQWARAELRRTLYDTSERVDAAHMLKYVFPFFGAWADVTQKWGRMVLDDPGVLRKVETVYDSPDRMGAVEERDGITYINMPGSWSKRMGFGDKSLAIPKPSLNLIFQGGSWWNPGAGWFVQFPLSKMIKRIPSIERNRLIKEVLPYGPDGTGFTDFVVQSGWLRRTAAIFDENNPIRKSTTVLIAMEENHKKDIGERDTAPTAKEIDNKVKNLLKLEAAARGILPFATNTRSPYQFYIDEYHKMRQQDPENAMQNFYDKYGDQYFIFTTNLSKNNTGIAATIEADKRTQQFSDLIAKAPEYGWFVVGEGNAGEFSPTVYQKQRETPVAPGSTTKMRESKDWTEAINDTEVNKGWLLYNQGAAIIEAKRIKRNLPSLNSRRARDLAQMKKDFVADLEAENPAWAAARGKVDTNKIINFLKFAKTATEDPRLKDRPDIQSVSQYIEGRDLVMQELQNRKFKGIDNRRNADLKDAWDAFVGELLDKDVTFANIYNRMLEKDDLTKGL